MSAPPLAAGRYRTVSLLGAGGMGTVLLARDELLDRLVALKFPADQFAFDPNFRARFEREARLAARLSHPNVVTVFDAGQQGDRPYLVMEYVEGDSLSLLLAQRGQFSPHDVAALGRQLASGLAHAHDLGVVHRDVKPHNVLVKADGTAKLTDFGIARAIDAVAATALTEVGTVTGTADYMAPEQATGGEAGPAADVYALGAVLHELLTGRPPARHGLTPPPSRDGALADLISTCLRPDPAARPTAAAVAGILGGPTGPVPEPGDSAARSDRPGPDMAATTLVAAGAPTSETPTPAPSGAATTVAAPAVGATELLPAPPPRAATAAGGPRRRPLVVPAVAVLLVALVALVGVLAAGRRSSGESKVEPVPTGATPAEDARNLAEWLRRQGG